MNEQINLLQGDCLERMKEIPDGSVDMILTDPPYGTTACKWDSIIPLEPMWEQLKRIIKPNGAIVMTAGVLAGGLIWGWLRQRTGSVWLPLLSHTGGVFAYLAVHIWLTR